ncbi:MAG: hypothetical protein IKS34_05125 [Clostridia bacterium]|nr:hypothetical protein [Clostridia bacterium]
MNKFELFTMIFYVLDAAWDESHNEQLGDYLSGANPFLFDDTGSADPAVFTSFCENVPDTITLENSYSIARNYILQLKNPAIIDAFSKVPLQEWIGGVNSYLSTEHKGKG